VIAKEIVRNVMEITLWQDIALLSVLAFGSFPLAKFTFDRLPEERKGIDKHVPAQVLRRFRVGIADWQTGSPCPCTCTLST
jgi:hypothetical protein